MTSRQKKEIILKRIEQGDKRSYNELVADLELQLWAANFGRPCKNKVI